MKISNNDLAIQRTKLANQRTYLSYIRTGFGIASISGLFKKWWITAFGIVMIIGSSFQYKLLSDTLNNKDSINNNKILDNLPLIYIFLSLGALYLQMNT